MNNVCTVLSTMSGPRHYDRFSVGNASSSVAQCHGWPGGILSFTKVQYV